MIDRTMAQQARQEARGLIVRAGKFAGWMLRGWAEGL